MNYSNLYHGFVYGPYKRRDGRSHVVIYLKNSVRKTVSLPKFIVEESCGKILEEFETIHHKNGNFDDNRLENLEVINRVIHIQNDSKRVKKIEVECVICKKKFLRHATVINDSAKFGCAGPFCSKQCSGRYGKLRELGCEKWEPQKEIPKCERSYYTLSKRLSGEIGETQRS